MSQHHNSRRNEILPHPATRTMRSNSKFAVKLGRENRQISGCKYSMVFNNKIHRILLNSNTEVEFVDLISPSCIWVKLKKNIANDLDFQEPYPMKQALQLNKNGKADYDSIKEYGYYLAPRQVKSLEDANDFQIVYSRVRLLDKKNIDGQLFCYVFYIDYGYGDWLNAKCLGVMPKSFYTHPWQVIPVSLLGVSPAADFDQNESNLVWTESQCEILKSILRSSKTFVARPALCKFHTVKTYEDYARVDLDYFTDEIEEEEVDESQKENKENDDGIDQMNEMASKRGANYKSKTNSVATEFWNIARQRGENLLFKSDCDEVTEQKLFGVENEIPPLPDLTKLPSMYCEFPKKLDETEEEIAERNKAKESEKLDNDAGLFQDGKDEDPERRKKLKEEKELNELIEWDPQIKQLQERNMASHQIKPFDHNLKEGDQFALILNTDCSKSPYEIYGHIIKEESSRDECYESVSNTYDDLDDWQEKLNDFYLNSTNCKRIDRERIYKGIMACENVYAILRITDQLEQSLFVRVKVLDCKYPDSSSNDISYCLVQFVDRGGTLNVNSDTLLRMHSKHADMPPLSIQMCLSEIVPVETQRNAEEPNEEWNALQREKFCQIVGVNIPMKCQLVGICTESAYCGNDYLHKTQGTHYIKDLRCIFEANGKTVEQSLIHCGTAESGRCP